MKRLIPILLLLLSGFSPVYAISLVCTTEEATGFKWDKGEWAAINWQSHSIYVFKVNNFEYMLRNVAYTADKDGKVSGPPYMSEEAMKFPYVIKLLDGTSRHAIGCTALSDDSYSCGTMYSGTKVWVYLEEGRFILFDSGSLWMGSQTRNKYMVREGEVPSSAIVEIGNCQSINQ